MGTRRARAKNAGTIGAVVLALGAFLAGCVDDPGPPAHHNPLDPDTPGSVLPGRPRNLTATVGDRRVSLQWLAPAGEAPAGYRLYRAEREGAALTAYALLDSLGGLSYADSQVTNGVEYRYRVAAVSGGLEGERSLEVAVVPAVYAVTVEGGALATRTRQVTLALTAPAGTGLVRVANDSLFTAAAFVAFATRLAWTLTEGDGPKAVYAEFRGPFGETSGAQSVNIELDTSALIRRVSEGSGGARLVPGDTLHVAVDAGETGGAATADIAGRRSGIRLFDDGTNGDPAAGDGVYELDHVVEGGDDVVDALVSGHFTDLVGNTATPVSATTRITIAEPPLAVTLLAPAESTETSLHLRWTQSQAADFATYRLFRAKMAGVDTATTRVLAADIRVAGTVAFVDDELEEDSEYFYVLYVEDGGGLATASNEVRGRTANRVPGAVTLEGPTAISPTSFSLRWSESTAQDFERYLLYRSGTPGVDTTALLVADIAQKDQRQTSVTGLVENTTYYFRVFVQDRSGLRTPSDELQATTANLPPAAVALSPPSIFTDRSVDLGWSGSGVHDFREYRVYRDTTAAVTQTSQLVRTVNDPTVVAHTDAGLTENTRYYYRLYVADTGDSLAGSNTVQVTTLNIAPDPVTLQQPDTAQVTAEAVPLTWTQSTVHDFASYTVRRATSPGLTEAAPTVFTTTLRSVMFFQDVGLSDSTAYYYRVYVVDDAAGATGSNEIRVLTDPAP